MSKQGSNNMEPHENDTEKTVVSDFVEVMEDVDPELLARLDQVCESGEAALAELDAYMEMYPGEEPYNQPDVAALLKEFEAKYSSLCFPCRLPTEDNGSADTVGGIA